MKLNSNSMYGITRIDDDRYYSHAWRVSLSRNGKRIVKNFPDRTWGSEEQALKMAMLHRDSILKKYPPLSRSDFCNKLRRNNKSGIPGVYKYVKTYVRKDGTLNENWYWEANWPLPEGNSMSRKQSFSVKTYGEKQAKKKAIHAREEGMRSVEGIYWATERRMKIIA